MDNLVFHKNELYNNNEAEINPKPRAIWRWDSQKKHNLLFFLNWNNMCPIKVAFSWKFWYAIGIRMAYIVGYGIRNHKLSKRSVKISSYSERTIGFRNNKCKKRLKNNSSLALQLFRWLARSDYLKVKSCKLYIITNIWSLQHQITDTEIFALIAALLSYWAGKFCL